MKAETLTQPKSRFGKPVWKWLAPMALVAVALLVWFTRGREDRREIATFAVKRAPLNISVIEGGSARAVESQEIKCEVRVGYQGIKILKIVEEGYEVTAEDIRTNKVLVELDSSELQKQITQQDIQFESAAATLTDAQQNYEIQLNQNLSDIKAAEQKLRFARMDFDKFLGANITQGIVDRLGIEQEVAAEQVAAAARASAVTSSVPATPNPASRPVTNAPAKGEVSTITMVQSVEGSLPVVQAKAGNGTNLTVQPAVLVSANATPPSAMDKTPDAPPPDNPGRETNSAPEPGPQPPSVVPQVIIDFSEYANIDLLGDGEAKQKLRKFEDDFQVAKKEQGQSKAKLEGTKRLFEKNFMTRIEMEQDEIASENSRLKVQTAATARDLFLKYEFPKTAEEALSKYAEAARELSRARKAAISKLAQAQAKLKSAQGQYNIQSRQRKEYYEQLDKCVIKATKPGLVVYGRGGDDMYYYGGEERIREGASVRERQSIITIPDMSKMSVRVKIHESYIKKVKKGQKAQVTVDAFPDKVIEGEVTSVGVLPDSQNMWMNPDMKVYLTTVTLTGTNEWLKPGMSAKVEIMVNRLGDVIQVPVQAVSAFEGKQVCYVAGGRKPERRVVEVGEFNDEFIEIKSGLKPGELVLLRPAETQPPEGGEKKQNQPPAEKSPAQPATLQGKI